MERRVGTAVAMTADGVTVLVDATDGRLPALLHWGRALPGLDAEQAEALRTARIPVDRFEQRRRAAAGGAAARAAAPAGWAGPGCPDPGTGGPGRPASASPRRGWTAPRSTGSWRPPTRLLERGRGGRRGRTGAAAHAASCCPAGCCARGRRSPTSPPTTTASTSWCWPTRCRPRPRELLDFAGRHNRERIAAAPPVRASAPTCGRTARAGPARTAPTCCTPARRASASPTGEVFAVHTAWSGNHTHFAERVFTGERVLGGGELLLPGEVRLRPGESYQGPWLYGAYGIGLDEVAGRFHRHLRGRPEPVSARPPGDAQRVGGGLLRPRPGPAAGAGRAGGRGRRRALRARRRLVRRPPQRQRRPRRLGGLARRLAGRAAPADRPGARAGHAVRALVRAGDGQPRLRRGPRPPRVDHGGARRVAARGPPPAGAQPGHPGGLRARQGAAAGPARRVRHRLHQVGPQPRPDRGGHRSRTAAGPACTRRRWPSTG